jgi:hypothetical protein
MQLLQCSQGRITLLLWALAAYIACNKMISKAAFLASPPLMKENTMLNALFGKRRRSRSHYQWKPALDLTNPRVAATLITFPTN